MEAYLLSEDYLRENASIITPRKSRNALERERENANEVPRIPDVRPERREIFIARNQPQEQGDGEHIDDIFEARFGDYFSQCIVVIDKNEKFSNFSDETEEIQMVDVNIFDSINQKVISKPDLHKASTSIDFNQSDETIDAKMTDVIDIPKIDPDHIENWIDITYRESVHSIPNIIETEVGTYVESFSIYAHHMLNILAVEKEIALNVLDLKQTSAHIESELKKILRPVSNNPQKLQLNLIMSKCFIYENMIKQQRGNNQVFLTTTEIQPDALGDGCFISSEELYDYSAKSDSLLNRHLVGMSTIAKFNLKFEQIQLLTKFTFSSKQNVRMEAKVKLLTSLNEQARGLFMTDPQLLLTHAIHESLINREELIEMLFFSGQRNEISCKQCPCCDQEVHRRNATIRHTKCSIIDWIQKFGFSFERGILHPKLMDYIPPTVCRYASKQYDNWLN